MLKYSAPLPLFSPSSATTHRFAPKTFVPASPLPSSPPPPPAAAAAAAAAAGWKAQEEGTTRGDSQVFPLTRLLWPFRGRNLTARRDRERILPTSTFSPPPSRKSTNSSPSSLLCRRKRKERERMGKRPRAFPATAPIVSITIHTTIPTFPCTLHGTLMEALNER